MPLRTLVVALVAFSACGPQESRWTEFTRPIATLEADGLRVVANREQFAPLPSQGGGEGGDMSNRRVDVWLLSGDSITRTHVGMTKTWLGGIDDEPWQGQWRAGHLWTWTATGLSKDGEPAAEIPQQWNMTTSLGRSSDGGVALAILRDDSSVAVWAEGEPALRELPELRLQQRSGVHGLTVVLSEGPRFGLAIGHIGDSPEIPTSVWAEGDPVTHLDAGTPLALYAAQAGTKTIVREYRGGLGFADMLYEDAGVRGLTQVSGAIAYTELSSAAIPACVSEGFDPQGTPLSLTGHVQGFTLRVGTQVLDVPIDGSNDVSWCSVTSDGQTVHVAWLEQPDRFAKAPTPRLLHHVEVVDGVQRAAPKVDIAVDLFSL